MNLPRRILFLAGFTLLVSGCVSETDDPGKKPEDATKSGDPGKAADPKAGAGKAGDVKVPDAGSDPKAAAPKAADPKTADPNAAGKDPTPPPAKKFTAAEFKAAKVQMQTFCVTCHGKSGKGDGPASLALNPKPRDWTDAKWHETVTDQKLFDVIKDGGAKHGLSPLMAPNPQFQSKPGSIRALVKMVRGFKGK